MLNFLKSKPRHSSLKLVNPFEVEGSWYKANLHCHTTASDGEATAQERMEQYSAKGYQVLAITDHEKTADVEGLSGGDFLVLNGIETHSETPIGGESYHFVGINVPKGMVFPAEMSVQERINIIKKAGGEAIYGHPYWLGHNINHLLAVQGYVAIEVYNSGAGKIGKSFSSVHWDDLLTAGRTVAAVAVDDTHEGRDIFMGWTMLKARNLSVGAVMESLRTGCYYASCGPTIEDFGVRDGKAFVRCSSAAEVHFMAQAIYGRSCYADAGPLMTYAEYELHSALKYIRAEVVDAKGNRAWTNPIIFTDTQEKN